ncbi:YfhJ family protein [Bacillus sp. 03113]|uniref:YfhJ family protein n=1 Tax=Bacillus sp. 03113 TaxID=2578211 RepID=UPI0011418F06|nr:YfhJ family protein [Bacillus sp. 03113]
MNEYQKKLVDRLLELNEYISVNQAETWIELLWEDFETTYGKNGRKYEGSEAETTEKIVGQWIEFYGGKLHEFVANNPKYKDFLETNKRKLH